MGIVGAALLTGQYSCIQECAKMIKYKPSIKCYKWWCQRCWKLRCRSLNASRRGWNGEEHFHAEPTTSLGKLSQWDPWPCLAAKAFWRIFTSENASDSSNFHHFCVGKKCWNCIRGKIVPGQNDTFAVVVPRYRGIFPAATVESAPTCMVISCSPFFSMFALHVSDWPSKKRT